MLDLPGLPVEGTGMRLAVARDQRRAVVEEGDAVARDVPHDQGAPVEDGRDPLRLLRTGIRDQVPGVAVGEGGQGPVASLGVELAVASHQIARRAPVFARHVRLDGGHPDHSDGRHFRDRCRVHHARAREGQLLTEDPATRRRGGLLEDEELASSVPRDPQLTVRPEVHRLGAVGLTVDEVGEEPDSPALVVAAADP